MQLFVIKILYYTLANTCNGRLCGTPCYHKNGDKGVCNGKGYCVSEEDNPCTLHGCGEKQCGDRCVQGDLVGVCDAKGQCEYDIERVICGISISTTIFLF